MVLVSANIFSETWLLKWCQSAHQAVKIFLMLIFLFLRKGLTAWSHTSLPLHLHEHLPVKQPLCSEPTWCFDVVSVC